MEDEKSQNFFNFSNMLMSKPSEVRIEATKTCAAIMNGILSPPGGESFLSFCARAAKLSFMKGFFSPLAIDQGEPSQEIPPEDIIEISDDEGNDVSVKDEEKNKNTQKQLVSIKKEPVESHQNLNPLVPPPDIVNTDKIRPPIPQNLFNKTELFRFYDFYQKTGILNQKIKLSDPTPVSPPLLLTEPQLEAAHFSESSESHSPSYSHSSNINDPLDLEIAYEAGYTKEDLLQAEDDEQDMVPLAKLRKRKEKMEGKKKMADNDDMEEKKKKKDDNDDTQMDHVEKVQVFPDSPRTKRRTRSTSAPTESPTGVCDQKAKRKTALPTTPIRKSKRKAAAPPETEPDKKIDTTKRLKKRKGQPTEKADDTQPINAAQSTQYAPQFLTPDLEERWKSSFELRQLLSERTIDVETYKKECQIVSLLEEGNLLRSVTKLKAYPPQAIKEFYANLMPSIDDVHSPHNYRAWVRGKFYNFSPNHLNRLFGIDSDDIEDVIVNSNTLAKTLSGGLLTHWPADATTILAKNLTSKHAILHKLAMTNWLAGEHRGDVNREMAELLYMVGSGRPVNLGKIVYDQVIGFLESKEAKIKLPYPCIIYGVLSMQGFKAYPDEQLEAPKERKIDPRLVQHPHIIDVLPEIQITDVVPVTSNPEPSMMLTVQVLEKSISDLNSAINTMVATRDLHMKLLRQLNLNLQEEKEATPDDCSPEA